MFVLWPARASHHRPSSPRHSRGRQDAEVRRPSLGRRMRQRLPASPLTGHDATCSAFGPVLRSGDITPVRTCSFSPCFPIGCVPYPCWTRSRIMWTLPDRLSGSKLLLPAHRQPPSGTLRRILFCHADDRLPPWFIGPFPLARKHSRHTGLRTPLVSERARWPNAVMTWWRSTAPIDDEIRSGSRWPSRRRQRNHG